MQTCQVCQHQNPSGADYCENCGAALNVAPQATPVGAAVGAQGSQAQNGVPGTSSPMNGVGAATNVPVPAPPANSPAPAVEGGPTAPPAPADPGPPPVPAASSSPLADTSAPAGTGPGAPAAVPTGGSPASATQPRLRIRRFGALTGEEIPLQGDRLMVGRFDPETGPVDLDLSALPEAEHISRHHGELYRESDGRWMVRDLGSTNGVFVKSQADPTFGPRITEPRPLQNGDEVAFGNARFVFVQE